MASVLELAGKRPVERIKQKEQIDAVVHAVTQSINGRDHSGMEFAGRVVTICGQEDVETLARVAFAALRDEDFTRRVAFAQWHLAAAMAAQTSVHVLSTKDSRVHGMRLTGETEQVYFSMPKSTATVVLRSRVNPEVDMALQEVNVHGNTVVIASTPVKMASGQHIAEMITDSIVRVVTEHIMAGRQEPVPA